ncbi:acetolactate synthase large subunit [Natronobacterium texcoconense]|uniref:Acetolactate synthase-1/2/3 large subunit n=1 Tax=Natronobacterium texcoconense TaxID=1095778 RepID=A0A1H1HJV4_NATTX|nr:acetolactate synthase large subunit [Natronobacterium texcoconense]SDR25780.1 acetolactate synthase-1/2/3 large subunit [Natronobacterium texcoconense]
MSDQRLDNGPTGANDRRSDVANGDDYHRSDETDMYDDHRSDDATNDDRHSEGERSAAQLLAACLEREGVDHVFGLPGEEMEELLFALEESDVTFVPTRHEQGAAFMADVHGRLTGEPGVCLATLGPGATNLLTGVADAHLDKSPLVAITAQGALERLHRESHQAIDVVDTFEPVTKWNAQLTDPDVVHEAVRKAFKTAAHEKPGATHLELPEDIASRETSADPLPVRDRVHPTPPDPLSVDRLLTELEAASRPVVIAGNGAIRTGAATAVRSFVDETGIPVVSTYMGKGVVSDESPRSLLTLDSGPDGEALEAIHRTDLVLSVGFDIAEHDPADWELGETTLVHLDTEPAEVSAVYDPELEVVANIAWTLREVTDRCRADGLPFETEWYEPLRASIVDDVDRTPAAEEPFTVRGVLPVLREVMDPSDVLVSDVGSHKMDIARAFPTYEPNTVVISNGLASMGIAVPGALAADLAVDENIVTVTGDGGFLMNAAEIETATRLDAEFTTVVFTDDDYGLISSKQRAHTGESVGTELTNPDFVAFAESFGIDGYRPTTREGLRKVLEDAVGDGMSLIEVPLT